MGIPLACRFSPRDDSQEANQADSLLGPGTMDNAQKGNPLSTESVTKIFRKIIASLPQSLQKSLHDHTGEISISPHDLRHTCAAVRLNQLTNRGRFYGRRTTKGCGLSSDGPESLRCRCGMHVPYLKIGLRLCGRTSSTSAFLCLGLFLGGRNDLGANRVIIPETS
jgi:hypothetical protein